jgi:hypothetical protein
MTIVAFSGCLDELCWRRVLMWHLIGSAIGDNPVLGGLVMV